MFVVLEWTEPGFKDGGYSDDTYSSQAYEKVDTASQVGDLFVVTFTNEEGKTEMKMIPIHRLISVEVQHDEDIMKLMRDMQEEEERLIEEEMKSRRLRETISLPGQAI